MSSKTLAVRNGLPARHLESVLQALVHDGILKGTRGPRGGYELARERNRMTINDILRATRTDDGPKEEPNSGLLEKVVMPVLALPNRNSRTLSTASILKT